MTTPNSTTERGVTEAEITLLAQQYGLCHANNSLTEADQSWQFAQALLSLAQSRQASAQGGADLIERIAQEWDECFYDAAGVGDIDIGKAIRGSARLATPPATTGMKEAPAQQNNSPAGIEDLIFALARWQAADYGDESSRAWVKLEDVILQFGAAIRAARKG